MGTAFRSFLLRTAVFFLPAVLVTGFWAAVAWPDEVSPQKMQELIDKAVKATDAQKRIEDIDKELSANSNLTEAQRQQLRDERADMDRSRQANEGTVRTLEGPEGNRIYDSAKEARQKEYELRQAEEQAARATGDEKRRAERRVNRLRLELQDLRRVLGPGTTFPPLPVPGRSLAGVAPDTTRGSQDVAQTPAAAQPGTPSVMPARGAMVSVSLSGTYHIGRKGGTRETATADINRRTKTHVTATLTGREENPEEWRRNTIGYQWNLADSLAPMTAAGTDGTYSLGYQIPRSELQNMHDRFGSLQVYGAGDNVTGTGDPGYGEVAHTIPRFPFSIPSFAEADDRSYDVPAGDLAIDDRISVIGLVMPNVSLQALDRDLTSNGQPGINAWNAWSNPMGVPIYQYWAEGLEGLDVFSALGGTRLQYVEPNEDRVVAVPHWNPARWPVTRAGAIPNATVHRQPAGLTHD